MSSKLLTVALASCLLAGSATWLLLPVKDARPVTYYVAHPQEREAMRSACANDASLARASADCDNAEQAYLSAYTAEFDKHVNATWRTDPDLLTLYRSICRGFSRNETYNRKAYDCDAVEAAGK
jgi:hypothetical protein